MKHEDFLVEILTEELPPKSLIRMGEAFCRELESRLKKANLSFSSAHFFATPRRLAVLVNQLANTQASQTIERKGPALAAAYDKEGKPTPACLGFARSLGVDPSQLQVIKNDQGEWVGLTQTVAGKPVTALLPSMVEEAALAIPVAKRMRVGLDDIQFVRPIHGIMMLYGKEVIEATILGKRSGRMTIGHRFLAPKALSIAHAKDYEEILKTKGFVLADPKKRREKIRHDVNEGQSVLISSDAFLDEVTGLVEWPCALCGDFDREFLALPKEILISAMQDHQRYFPVIDAKGKLAPHFVTISNIESKDPARVIEGNERVLRARLKDAAFFYESDKKESLESRLPYLKGIIFQVKLGTLYDKSERISKLSAYLAGQIANQKDINNEQAIRAGLLAKTDLTTQMVGEFPELQGIMGGYYADFFGEDQAVCLAISEHYLPRFSGDQLPHSPLGIVLAIADRIDNLVGNFGITQIPTGEKDPFGLRRAALSIIRMIIENELDLSLLDLINFAFSNYGELLPNKETTSQVLNFMLERLRFYYQEQGVSADVFQAVVSLSLHNLLDIHKRIAAVLAFKELNEAKTLSMANKRVSHILAQYTETIAAKHIDPHYFEHAAEETLAQQLALKSEIVSRLSQQGDYKAVLLQLSELSRPIDDFFDHVMVMTEDKSRRENRLLLLVKLRALFLQVADIALLQ